MAKTVGFTSRSLVSCSALIISIFTFDVKKNIYSNIVESEILEVEKVAQLPPLILGPLLNLGPHPLNLIFFISSPYLKSISNL